MSDMDKAYERHESKLQRLVGYLMQGGTTGTSLDEIGVLSRKMVDAALAEIGTLYREATRDEIAIDNLGVVSAVDVYTMDVVQVFPKEGDSDE